MIAPHETVLPPDILPVVFMSGSDYEMGFQYGQQAAPYIDQVKVMAWANILRKFERTDVLFALKSNLFYVRKYTPECINMMEGMADGVNSEGYSLTFEDVLLLNSFMERQSGLAKPGDDDYPREINEEEVATKGCSVCSAWGRATVDGRLIGVDCVDLIEPIFALVLVVYPDNGNNYMCVTRAGSLSDHFIMNNKGLYVGNSGGGQSPRSEDFNYGLNWSNTLSHMVRYANTAREAREMITSWQINIGENFHIVDVRGNGGVVEKTASIQAVRMSGDFDEEDFLFSTNTFLSPQMGVTKEGDFASPHSGFGPYSQARNMMLWDMLHNYKGYIDLQFMKMLLRFPDEKPEGWNAKICRYSNAWVVVVVPDDGDEGVAHICTGSAAHPANNSRVDEKEGFSESQANIFSTTAFASVNGTRTFYQLKLSVNPENVVTEARHAAKEDIGRAYETIKGVGYSDMEYAALNEIYATAHSEYEQGMILMDKGFLADGNESLALYGKAATGFTRAQAHANQVVETIVPQPRTPTDLGLKPFAGDWAKWETDETSLGGSTKM